METTSIFLVGSFLYVFMSVAVGWGGKWRKFLWFNIGLSLSVSFLLSVNAVLVFLEGRWDPLAIADSILQIVPIPMAWRSALVNLRLSFQHCCDSTWFLCWYHAAALGGLDRDWPCCDMSSSKDWDGEKASAGRRGQLEL